MRKALRTTMRALALTAVLTIATMAPAHATFTLLRSFSTAYMEGAYPVGRLANIGGVLYGLTRYGTNGVGSAYKTTTTGVVTHLHDFVGGAADGTNPNSGLIPIGSTLYGMTISGGSSNIGVIFKMTTAGVVTVVHTFVGGVADGTNPYGGMIYASDLKLYGTTYQGGTMNQGIIFSFNPVTTTFAVVHSFDNTTDSIFSPIAGLCEGADGFLYGTSYNCSGFNGGFYKIKKDGTGFALLHGCLTTEPTGYNPWAQPIKGADNNIYGTCRNGGPQSQGVVWKWNTTTNTFSQLYAFDGTVGSDPGPAPGYYTQQMLTQGTGTDTNLYGTTISGGYYGRGTVFKVTMAGVGTQLASFKATDGNQSGNPLVQSGTTFYFTSFYGGNLGSQGPQGGSAGNGAIMSITPTGTFKTLYSFFNRDCYNPYGGLVQIGTAFYGTCYYGGNFQWGAIFKITSAGVYSIIHHFNYYLGEGYYPIAGLLKGADGMLYGTTTGGGWSGANGTIYKCSVTGAMTVIHNFIGAQEGYYPQCALAQGIAPDKTLYGTCYYGGSNGTGTLFSVDTAGASYKVLKNFGGVDGTNPACTPVPDASGNIYGTCHQGGVNGLGTIYKVTKTGATFTKLWDFGSAALAPFYPNRSGFSVLAGNFLYGTTGSGGTNGHGTLYQFDVTTNSLAVMHSMSNGAGDGYNTVGGLFYDSVNNVFYGTSFSGGSGGGGVVWKYDNTGNIWTNLHQFVSADGYNVGGGVILATDGLLYGTAINGGATNYGTLFKQTTVP